MKIQYMMLVTLVMTFGLHAMNISEIVSKLTQASTNLERAAYGLNPQNQASSEFNQWFIAFMTAKNFVIDNSKDLIGNKDTSIMNAILNIDDANTKLLNIINFIHTSSNKNSLITRSLELTHLKSDISKTINNLNYVNLTLPNKQKARDVINSIANCLQEMINRINKIVGDYINLG